MVAPWLARVSPMRGLVGILMLLPERDSRCASESPAMVLDVGPRRCRGNISHAGFHHARFSDGHEPVGPLEDRDVYWDDVGHFHPYRGTAQ
jgi:hypothetical protein